MRWWPQLGVGHFGHIALMLQAVCTGLNRLLHLIGHSLPAEMPP